MKLFSIKLQRLEADISIFCNGKDKLVNKKKIKQSQVFGGDGNSSVSQQ